LNELRARSGFVIFSLMQSPRTFFRFIIAVAMLLVGLTAYWYTRKQHAPATATLEQITAQAKRTVADDRAAWVALARQSLKAENTQPIAPPIEPVSNRSHLPAAELGHLLFFDPVLSGNQKTACASCHHPAYGLADGLPKAIGGNGNGYGAQRKGTGTELARNTPSLFNTAYQTLFFWDARAGSLEEQVFAPLFSEHEMNLSNLPELLRRLRAVPRYRELFSKAFGANSQPDGSDITLPNIARALAAFQRKLNIIDTNYDRFVSGKDDALSTEQLRGMVAFFGQGQCNVCHIAPLFHDDSVAAIGVPAKNEKGAPLDADAGFGAVLRRADGIAKFKTPGLRNIERTAPYMHNGSFATLEDVVKFYNEGGGLGRNLPIEGQDFRVKKLELTEQQERDLVAFLKSLNDLAPAPMVPAVVPSGLSLGKR
jgi:cytochrome c peroxidase